ncbi:DUF3488 and transglutaminase-like domain-containing protein [Glaciihabitans sp. dw_435]|uniref:transglutaminase family protein n=1 Tax=Glaciihabitans sp. dw_435 TaxID=2720081 RepID=UPI001BD39D62|nr:DUF3488 and transglutaminase-like domain-containing protein [Glaciihabitans sp. dw_435]
MTAHQTVPLTATTPARPGVPRQEPSNTAGRGTAGRGGFRLGGPRRGSAPRDRGGELRSSVLLFIALAVALGGLHSVLAGIGWWLMIVAVALVVLGGAAAVRYFSNSRVWGTVVALLLAFGTVTVLFAADTAILGVIPTFDSWAQFGNLALAGQTSITEQGVPADAVPGIQFLLCVAVAGIAVVLDGLVVWWKSPALAGVPLLLVASVPGIIQDDFTEPFVLALVAVIYLLLLRPRTRRVQPSTAIGLGAVAIAGALVVPLLLPPVSVPTDGNGFSSVTAGINPIIDLGRDLRQSNPTTALRYTTSSDNGQYLRLTTLETFDGREWSPVSTRRQPGNSVDAIAAPPGLGPTVTTTEVQTQVNVDNTVSQWLPVPYPAKSIDGLQGSWFWEPDGLSVRTSTSNMRDQTYTVTSLEVTPTSTQLQGAADSSDSPLAQVPAGLDPIVAQTAADITRDGATKYDKAELLQSWFRGGAFTYSEEAPVREGFDGSGLDVIVPFLEAKTGYCVHFASTMAIMARTLGIPSRVAVGFLPGTGALVAGSDKEEYTVSSKDLHAWPELYFEGAGWVRFEPTPGLGIVPVFQSAPVDDPATPNVDESQATATPTPTAAPTTGATQAPEDVTADTGITPAATPASALRSALILVGILIVLLIPAIFRVVLRARRMAVVRRGPGSAAAAWLEIGDTARDLWYPDTLGATPRELSIMLRDASGMSPPQAEALDAVRMAVEREVYSADSAAVSAQTARQTRVVLHALRRAGTTNERVRATLLPRTLFDRALTLGARLPRA